MQVIKKLISLNFIVILQLLHIILIIFLVNNSFNLDSKSLWSIGRILEKLWIIISLISLISLFLNKFKWQSIILIIYVLIGLFGLFVYLIGLKVNLD